jgi:hypothetical protein
MSTQEAAVQLIAKLKEALQLSETLMNAYPNVWTFRWVWMWVSYALEMAEAAKKKVQTLPQGGKS